MPSEARMAGVKEDGREAADLFAVWRRVRRGDTGADGPLYIAALVTFQGLVSLWLTRLRMEAGEVFHGAKLKELLSESGDTGSDEMLVQVLASEHVEVRVLPALELVACTKSSRPAAFSLLRRSVLSHLENTEDMVAVGDETLNMTVRLPLSDSSPSASGTTLRRRRSGRLSEKRGRAATGESARSRTGEHVRADSTSIGAMLWNETCFLDAGGREVGAGTWTTRVRDCLVDLAFEMSSSLRDTSPRLCAAASVMYRPFTAGARVISPWNRRL